MWMLVVRTRKRWGWRRLNRMHERRRDDDENTFYTVVLVMVLGALAMLIFGPWAVRLFEQGAL